jgi:hypothetical protein
MLYLSKLKLKDESRKRNSVFIVSVFILEVSAFIFHPLFFQLAQEARFKQVFRFNLTHLGILCP